MKLQEKYQKDLIDLKTQLDEDHKDQIRMLQERHDQGDKITC